MLSHLQNTDIQNIKKLTVKLFDLTENYIDPNFASDFNHKTNQNEKNNYSHVAYAYNGICCHGCRNYFYSSDNFLENKDHLLSILNAIAPNREDIYSNLKMADVLKLSFKSNHYWSTIPVNYFLTIFCFVVEEYDNAIQYLQSYMKETNCETDMYYQSVLSLFQLYKKGETSEIKNQIPKEVIDDFADRQALLKYIDLPICPNCCACKLQEACQTKNIVGAILRISNQMRRDLRQENLCNLFDNAFPPK